MTARVDKVVTAGTFSLDGEDFAVENNIWLFGDDREVLVVDAAHDAAAIAEAVGDRRVVAIVCTHGHNDHINAAVDLAERVRAPIALHSADRMLWDAVHPDTSPDIVLDDKPGFRVGDHAVFLRHTPGHSPGGVSLYDEDGARVFAGDTLFNGGPGATGRSFSDFPTIIESIKSQLLVLPPDTIVHTGHGDDTTIGAEAPHLDEWVIRGH